MLSSSRLEQTKRSRSCRTCLTMISTILRGAPRRNSRWRNVPSRRRSRQHYQLAEAYLERVETLRASAAAEPGEPGGEAPVDAKAAPANLPERRRAKFGERVEP